MNEKNITITKVEFDKAIIKAIRNLSDDASMKNLPGAGIGFMLMGPVVGSEIKKVLFHEDEEGENTNE